MQRMDKNAELVITRHRALFTKPGDLKELVKLPLKRKAKDISQEAQTQTSIAKIRDIVFMLHEATTSKELAPAVQQRLSADWAELTPAA